MDGRLTPFFSRIGRRKLIMLSSLVLFLPPLSALFQLTQDVNFCGRWCPRMFFVWREGTSLEAYFAVWLRAWMGVGLVVLILGTTFVFGRYWCSHVCPIGGFMELASRLIPARLKLDFSIVPAPAFRYAYLAVYIVAPAIGIGSLCCNYCNFAVVPRLFGAAFSEADLMYFLRIQGLINLGLLLLLGVFAAGGRAYCNLLCPVGAMDALSSKFGSRVGHRMRINHEACSNCGSCASVCPTWAIETQESTTISQLSCMPCRECQTACPNGAISYDKTSK